MKVVLFLVGFLLAAAVCTDEYQEYLKNIEKCFGDCNNLPIHKRIRVCAESGKTYGDRCYLDCDIKFRHGGISDGDIKEVDCKPGTLEYCWNAECTEKEKTFLERPIKPLCEKDPPHDYTRLPCSVKCMKRIYEKKEVEFVSCIEVGKEEKPVSV